MKGKNLLVALAALYVGCSPAIRKAAPNFYESSRLVLNNNPRIVLKVTKDYEEGLRDIQSWVDRADREESYAYLPERKEWVETGMESEKFDAGRDVVGGVRTNPDVYERLLGEENEIIFIHTHSSYRYYLGSWIELYLEENIDPESVVKETTRSGLELLVSVPSPQDIKSMIWVSREFYGRGRGKNLDFRVIAPGIETAYRLTQKGKEELMRGMPVEEIIKESVSGVLNLRGYLQTKPLLFFSAPRDVQKEFIEAICNTEYLEVRMRHVQGNALPAGEVSGEKNSQPNILR